MKKIILLFIIHCSLLIPSARECYSQPCGYYDKEINTFHLGFNNNFYINNNPAPPLFNWQMVHATPSYFITDIFFVDSLYGWATHGNGGVFKTTNSGFNWIHTADINPGGCICGVHFINRDTGWIVGAYRLIRKTISGGARWIIQDNFQSDADYRSVFFFNSLTGFSAGKKYPGGGFIIRTTNSGQNWVEAYVHSLATSEIREQFWLNEDTGWFCGSSILLKTTNGGMNFINYYSNIPPTSNGANGLNGIYFVNEQMGWISASNLDHKNMYKTTNSGINWVFQDNPIALYEFPQLDDVIFINENTGWSCAYAGQIIVTTNGGLNWLTDLSYPNWFHCFAKYNSSKVWCGAHYSEFWYLDDTNPIGIHQIGNEIPGNYNLKQNYPNPFNGQTMIEFGIPIREKVAIKVFDILGREIEKITDDAFEPGTYKINYNADKLSSGVYIYKIEAGGFKDIKKMVLLK